MRQRAGYDEVLVRKNRRTMGPGRRNRREAACSPVFQTYRPEKGPKRTVHLRLRELANAICEEKSGENLFVIPSFPRFLYIAGGNMGWRMQAKQNGLKICDLSLQK